jgi:hypothetical protein
MFPVIYCIRCESLIFFQYNIFPFHNYIDTIPQGNNDYYD